MADAGVTGDGMFQKAAKGKRVSCGGNRRDRSARRGLALAFGALAREERKVPFGGCRGNGARRGEAGGVIDGTQHGD